MTTPILAFPSVSRFFFLASPLACLCSQAQARRRDIEKVLAERAKREDFVIREATEEVEVTSASIVNIDSKKPTFWRQLQGGHRFRLQLY